MHAPAETFEFGPFRLDVTERKLVCEQDMVALTPKAFDMLVALVGRAGHLVTREELLREVWRDTFVEEANLNYTVSLLRKALGDAPDEPTYIQTISKQGYRFIAPVRRVSSQPLAVRHLSSDVRRQAGAPNTTVGFPTLWRPAGRRAGLGGVVWPLLRWVWPPPSAAYETTYPPERPGSNPIGGGVAPCQRLGEPGR